MVRTSLYRKNVVQRLVWVLAATLGGLCYGYDIPQNIPVLIQSESATCYNPSSTAYKEYVISHLAPRVDILELWTYPGHFHYLDITVKDTQEWIDIAHRYGMRTAISNTWPGMGDTSRAVGPANLYSPNYYTIRPADGTLGTYSSFDRGDTVVLDQSKADLKSYLSLLRGVDYFMFNECRYSSDWPSNFDNFRADAPYFAWGTYSDASLADFRDYTGNSTAKFPVLAEDICFVTDNPGKFTVVGNSTVSDKTYWNKWWSWRFHAQQRWNEGIASAVYEAMSQQDNRYFKEVIFFQSNRWTYETAYNIQHIHRKGEGVAIDDLQLPYMTEPVPGMTSSEHIDIVISEDGDDGSWGPSESVQYFKTAAEKYGKDWGNFLSLWSWSSKQNTPLNILDEALDITTAYDSRIVAAYEDGVFIPDPDYNKFDNYSQEQCDWWDQHFEPRAQIPLMVTGDATGNGVVDLMDLLYVRDYFGLEEPDPDYNAYADLNNDGIIDLLDLLVVRDNFGLTVDDLISQGQATAIPEPVSVFLWIMVTMLAIKYKTRRSLL